ncbi:DUF1569 domain-containing protein [Mucilaginibacter agri]|uniref:DUF1569 domain-containing protein n=1 Tax=Mucilaginibacter agri TaxID=2695265 RepID=A0A965ZGI4_9SPHI|nr:DUF1569 domain-containing protein [Mucilaginibacter agri]NCD70639.1 DUF1569 domain-containing protein [Mucilaginibacter agri]
MISITDKHDRQNLINRIQQLNENSMPLWGKMSAYQMLRHCSLWHEMALRQRTYKQAFIGRLFGKVALKSMLKDEPLKQNMPTVPSFIVKGEGDISSEKQKLISLIDDHAQCTNSGFIHPFFGKMSLEQGIAIASKHLDHHLKQFGV